MVCSTHRRPSHAEKWLSYKGWTEVRATVMLADFPGAPRGLVTTMNYDAATGNPLPEVADFGNTPHFT